MSEYELKNPKGVAREERYKKYFKENFDGVFEYISNEAVEDKTGSGRWRYYITAKCCKCGEIRTASSVVFINQNHIKCMCQDTEALKKSAKKYAKILYTSISKEAKTYGFLHGQELEDYVMSCVKYDRPELSKLKVYCTYVLKYLQEEYKAHNVKKCSCCGRLLTEASMYFYNKTICVPCHKEKMRLKRLNKIKDKRRKGRR